MKIMLPVISVVALALAGCATNNVSDVKAPTSSTYQVHSANFICANGMTPKLTYINDSQAQLTLEGTTTTLTLDTAGSGERYVSQNGIFGYGGEWHQKGDVAAFAYKNLHGVPAEVACEAE